MTSRIAGSSSIWGMNCELGVVMLLCYLLYGVWNLGWMNAIGKASTCLVCTPTVILDGLYVWAQIHGIPDMYRDAGIVDQLARQIGRVKEVQLAPRLFYEGDYVRVRARVFVAKPLTRVTPLTVTGEGRRMFPDKYEKIPYFCQVCGLMGHNHEECGDGVWEAKHKQWGSWMLAQRKEMATATTEPQGGRTTRGG